MFYYFAPMEGITDSVFRTIHHNYFPGVDRYYLPFFSPTIHRQLTPREQRELPPADCVDYAAVPQILTKNPEDFLWAAQVCGELGYKEVNLNVGCPSGTVVSKGKGAGMLRSTDDLKRFLEATLENSPIPVSVKTRLGMENPEEFQEILAIYNQFPISELIVHPRVRTDYYKEPVREEWFAYAVANSKAPLCFNGNLTTVEQCRNVAQRYPELHGIMVGRGLVGDPGMLSRSGTQLAPLQEFHDALLDGYIQTFGSQRNAMFRMKENWHYLSRRFVGCDALWKKLRKCTDVGRYRELTTEIFETLPLAPELQADW